MTFAKNYADKQARKEARERMVVEGSSEVEAVEEVLPEKKSKKKKKKVVGKK